MSVVAAMNESTESDLIADVPVRASFWWPLKPQKKGEVDQRANFVPVTSHAGRTRVRVLFAVCVRAPVPTAHPSFSNLLNNSPWAQTTAERQPGRPSGTWGTRFLMVGSCRRHPTGAVGLGRFLIGGPKGRGPSPESQGQQCQQTAAMTMTMMLV